MAGIMSPGMRELSLYLAVGAIYVTLGVFFQWVLFSWPVGAGFLLFGVWIVPAAIFALIRLR